MVEERKEKVGGDRKAIHNIRGYARIMFLVRVVSHQEGALPIGVA